MANAPHRPSPSTRRCRPLFALLGAALWGCTQGPAPSAGDGHGDGPEPSDGPPEERLYPRPGARPPSFAATPPPRPIQPRGTLVGHWDLSGGALSRDGTAVSLALAAMGIPSEPIARPSQLVSYQVIVLTGDLSESSVPPETVEKIAAALTAGSAVLAVAPRVEGIEALAGIAGRAPVQSRRALLLQEGGEPLLQELRVLAEGKIQLAGPAAEVATQGYTVPLGAGQVLARFDDGSAALVRRGNLYILGLRAQYYLDLAAGSDLGLASEYTNRHALQGDLLPLLLRRFYLAHAPKPQVRKTAPEGRRAAVILTHDCDSPFSAEILPGFAALERQHGVRATYMVATSSYSNGIMGAVYRRPMIDALRTLLREGFDVGSHSFGHFPDFHRLPARLGDESAANYLPRYSQGRTTGASLFGELQISRALLEEDLGAPVSSFRPGFLVMPPTYYQELVDAGYRRSSSRAAGHVRVNFPYRAVRVRAGGYEVYPVIEYPIAISDRDLDDTNVAQRVAEWVGVVDRNSLTGAPTVLLLHPSSRPGRTASLAAFLDALRGRDLWVGDLATFAAFYEEQGF